MAFKPPRPRELFIFGAGAAKPYGAPTWDELKEMLPMAIAAAKSPPPGENHYEMTDDIKGKLQEIARAAKGYATIDKAITEEMRLKFNNNEEAESLERIFWDIMERCMNDAALKKGGYNSSGSIGWIGELLRMDMRIAKEACFINFNYDSSFPYEMKRYLNHLLDVLGVEVAKEKERVEARYPSKDRKKSAEVQEKYNAAMRVLSALSARMYMPEGSASIKLEQLAELIMMSQKNIQSRVFFPHGLFLAGQQAVSDCVLKENYQTYVDVEPVVRKGRSGDAISCCDADKNSFVFQAIEKADIKADFLYVIGVGGGLEVNLNKIDLGNMGIKKVIYTCSIIKEKYRYEDYFRDRIRGLNVIGRAKDHAEFMHMYNQDMVQGCEWAEM